MKKHFQCTACGKCCYGQLPLTWKDADANMGRFPIALVWTPVLKGSRDFGLASKIGAVVNHPQGGALAVIIAPTSFIPSTFACPALGADQLCQIHERKPIRCKTMPFYSYLDEKYQGDLLSPRKDWACDTSEQAPVVYENNRIIARNNFDCERQDLLAESKLMQAYADYMLKHAPWVANSLMLAVKNVKGHNKLVTSLSSFLTAMKHQNRQEIATLQMPVLQRYASLTADDPSLSDFHKNYTSWCKEMSYLTKTSSMKVDQAAMNGLSLEARL